MTNYNINLAYDKRTIDDNGFMHIPNCVFTEEGIEEYLGSEIPECEAFGLKPDMVYRVYRPLSVLEEAVSTFNNLPVLDKHVPVFANLPNKESWYGTTGEQSEIRKDPGKPAQLIGNMVIYLQEAIDGINENRLKSLSAGYHRKHRNESGVWEGKPYDLVLEEIKGNHIAFVSMPRIANAMIGDSKLKREVAKMAHNLKSQIAKVLGFDSTAKDNASVQKDHDINVLRMRQLELLDNIDALDESGRAELKEISAMLNALLGEISGDAESPETRKEHERAGLLEYWNKKGKNEKESKSQADYDRGTGLREYYGKDESAEERKMHEGAGLREYWHKEGKGKPDTPAESKFDRGTGFREYFGEDSFEEFTKELIAHMLPILKEQLTIETDEKAEAVKDAEAIMGNNIDKKELGKDSDAVYATILKSIGMDSAAYKTAGEKKAAVKMYLQTRGTYRVNRTPNTMIGMDGTANLQNDHTFAALSKIKGV